MEFRADLSFLLLVFLILGTAGCGDQEPGPTPSVLPDNSAMVRLLEEAYSKVDPMTINFYDNARRAAIYKQKMQQADEPSQMLLYNLQYGYEMLGAGENEAAIVEFEKLLQIGERSKLNADFLYQVRKMLALAYIRLGETQNCIEQYNTDACLMPLQGEGLYTLTESSERAIQLYQQMLAEQPEDYEAQWLLNFAYMTMGRYPADVPPEYRIPAEAFQSDYDLPAFPNIADKLGVATVALSGGACVEDFNGDGLLDIVASSWGTRDQLRLYVQDGQGGFTDATESAGLMGLTGGLQTNHADYNNDGWPDIFVLRGAWYGASGKIPNSLLRNNGDGTFTDVTQEAGLLYYAPTQTATWADFNLDGWLDVFVGNESNEGYLFPSQLYLSNRDGTFREVLAQSGIKTNGIHIKGSCAGDINNDGWPELYISSMNSRNLLYAHLGIDKSGIPRFSDIAPSSGTEKPLRGFPCWFFDFDNDGWEDLFAGSFGVPEGQVAAHLATLNFRGQYTGGYLPPLPQSAEQCLRRYLPGSWPR